MNFIASLEPHVIMYILSSISEGLTALGKDLGYLVCTSCQCLKTLLLEKCWPYQLNMLLIV